MAHNLYVDIEDEYNGRESLEGQDDYPYARPPDRGVKHIRNSEILPDYLREGACDTFSPNQARMFAECLNNELTSLWPRNEPERKKINQVQRTANWLKYWADQEKEITGAP